MTDIQLSLFDNSDFDRGAPKWKEILWLLVRSVFFASWFPVPNILKVLLLRMFGADIGASVIIRSRVNITFPWRFSCGDHVWLGDEVMILSLARVKLGSNVCISQRAFVCTGSHNFESKGFDLVVSPVCIEDGCWVGASCFIAPGITMGRSSRCLPGAVVVKNVSEEVTVSGVPATI